MKTIYCKYSNDRAPQFQIKTLIQVDENGKKVVGKYALSEEGREHIEGMYRHYLQMKNNYADTLLCPNTCTKQSDGAIFEFLNGKTLEEQLDDLYFQGKYIELIEKIVEFKDILYGLKDNIPYSYTPEFEKIFGAYGDFSDCTSLSISNIDLVFENILVGDKWTIIDYEWIFDFPVPISYILYRAIYYYVHGSTKRSRLIKFDIFGLLGITEEDIKIYSQMECHFQKFVAAGKATMADLKSTMLKNKENVLDICSENGKDYIQVYSDRGQGYSEEDSQKKFFLCKDREVVWDFRTETGIQSLRIDPASRPVMLKDLIITANGELALPTSLNGVNVADGVVVFLNSDPQIILSPIAENVEICVKYKAVYMTEPLKEGIAKIINERKECQAEVDKKNSEFHRITGEEIAKLHKSLNDKNTEYQALWSEYNRINGERQALSDYVQRLHSRRSWRVLSLGWRIMKSVKNVGLINTSIKGAKKIKRKLIKEKVVVSPEVVQAPVQVPIICKNNRKVSEKEKVLVVVHEAQRAGATLLSINIIQTIKAVSDYEPVILLMSGGPLTEKLRRMGLCYELNQVGFAELQDEAKLSAIIREIADLGVKYALCNSVVTGLVVPELKKNHIKTITMIHELSTSIRAYNFVKAAKNVLEYSDDIVFAADFVRNHFVDEYPVQEERCHIIPQGCYSSFNSLSMSEKAKNKQRLCKELGIEESSKIVLGCGYGNLRKGLDWFGMIAARELERNRDVHFIWLGSKDEEIKTWVDNDLAVKQLQGRFHWMSHVDNPGYIFGGADAFLLSSREDPFPSVALEAMKQFTPVLAFGRSGGIPEILGDNRGIVVPYGDCDAMAREIDSLLADKCRYDHIVSNAKRYVSEITPRKYVTELLKIVTGSEEELRRPSELKVSVVIPNYNYERYIYERISSILNQTVKPFEVIFLDDVSKDNSVAVATEILEAAGIRHKIVANTTNKGCFKQWLSGVRMAEGDIIWIAEADDLCELDFLERLLPFFEDDQVNLAYAQSEVIYENNERSNYIYTEYTKDLSDTKWETDYVNYGEAEIIDGLGIKNTIPNASGTLMRKKAFDGIDEQLSKFVISGDWFAYVYLIKTGKIAFCSDVLNYHRRHKNSIIHQKEQDICLFVELMKIKLFIAENFMIPEGIKERFTDHVRNEYQRLMPESSGAFGDNQELSELQNRVETMVDGKLKRYSFLHNIPRKNILYVIPDFEMGGGQTLVIRLANYFSRFHNVYMYNARPWLCEARIRRMISDKVTILESDGTPEQLRNYIQEEKIDIINDHIWWSDKIVYKAAHDLNVRIILSMHGCYEALLQHPEWDGEFAEMAPQILMRADEIIYATDKNKKIFDEVPVLEKTHQIHYGYEVESIPQKERNILGIDEDSFVFGMVARGIKEKGFGEAADAFKQLRKKNSIKMDLVLIGNGPFIDELKKRNKEETQIHFVDNLKRPSEWIGWVKTFNCALLPTYFVSESLPNSVIEYLAYGVPVISTNIGDIRSMLIGKTEKAGIVLELKDGVVEIDDLEKAMEVMLKDEKVYQRLKDGTKSLFSQFDIKEFAERYYMLYNS